MSARIPQYVLKAGIDVVHTWKDWVNSEEDDEGERMDAHVFALSALIGALCRDVSVVKYLRDDEVVEFFRES